MNPQDIRTANLKAAVDGQAQRLHNLFAGHPGKIEEAAQVSNCLAQGYAPKGYRLADFCILYFKGLFHLFHIPRVPGNSCIFRCNEHWIAHAVSTELDTWITCNPALCVESVNYYESSHVWAPFVLDGPEETIMFYTGLSDEPSQVLCSARSTDPDLAIWKRDENNPIIPLEGFDWHWLNHKKHVRNGRDPHVVKTDHGWLLAYTAMHRNGCPAVGGMVSDDLKTWQDVGPILYRPMHKAPWAPESVNIQQLDDGRWVLIPSQSPGLEYYISDTPFSWHDSQAVSIEYTSGDQELPVGLEVILRDDQGAWLVAFFETTNNRLFIGELNTNTKPWELTRLSTRDELNAWYKKMESDK